MKPFTILKKTWYWSYDRGTWQYDLMCVAILAFIFLIPASVFDDPEARHRPKGGLHESIVAAEAVPDGSIESLSAAVGGEDVHRVEPLRNEDGRIRAYRVWSVERGAGH